MDLLLDWLLEWLVIVDLVWPLKSVVFPENWVCPRGASGTVLAAGAARLTRIFQEAPLRPMSLTQRSRESHPWVFAGLVGCKDGSGKITNIVPPVWLALQDINQRMWYLAPSQRVSSIWSRHRNSLVIFGRTQQVSPACWTRACQFEARILSSGFAGPG